MSFILDALRKVDRETRESSVVEPPVAAVEKLRMEKRKRRLQFAAMAAIGVASATATALLLRRPPRPEVSPALPAPPFAAEAPVEPPVEIPFAEAPRSQPAVEVPQGAPREPANEQEAGASAPVSAIPQLVLQGTSVLAGKPVAVVSDRRVFVGDLIEGAIVLRIEERLVELEFDGRRFTLTF